MKCPHCGVAIPWAPTWNSPIGIGYQDARATWLAETQECAGCNKLIVQLVQRGAGAPETPIQLRPELQRIQALPRATNRAPCPAEVPSAIQGDYTEACLVLADSPKASAALSRRCLQHILREAAGVTPGNLAQEIDQALADGKFPTTIANSLDAVREIGNFAAHPMKGTNTGEVIDVEPGEAEWNLDVVEALMDIYYVQPAVLAAKKAALNAKLAEAGRPQIP